jgi:hypothetical protein
VVKIVEFLDINATSSEPSKMISRSKEKLYLVNPYLQMSDKIKIIIQQAEEESSEIDIKRAYPKTYSHSHIHKASITIFLFSISIDYLKIEVQRSGF